MMKKIAMLILILLLSGCGTYLGCRQVKQFYVEEKSCASGYLSLGITGHGPSCADEQEIKNIKAECGWMF
jgi:hypothetical protein